MTEYNQAFKDCLMFMSKFLYLKLQRKSLQTEIIELAHWLDDHPATDKKTLLNKLAGILRKYMPDESIRY